MRLDQALVRRRLVASRTFAQKLIESGSVTVDGVVITKTSRKNAREERLEVTQYSPFVSRGGEKLDFALDFFRLEVAGRDCLDIGASTGGFTHCLLSRGANRVFCVDSGSNQLHETLRTDARVSFQERFNARYMTPDDLPFTPQIAVMDVSFISQTLILEALEAVLARDGTVISLIKPQFELSPQELGKNGVVRDEKLHQKAIERVQKRAKELGFLWRGVTNSPLEGGDGNREFLCYLTR